MSSMEELIEEIRKGILSLVGQLKLPPEQYKDENVIPIVWSLKKSLQNLKAFQSTNVNVISFSTSAGELIPVVVSLLRNKSQGLDTTQDEERLKPAVKAFQLGLQKINSSPPSNSSSPPPASPSPIRNIEGGIQRRNTASNIHSGSSPVLPRTTTPQTSPSPQPAALTPAPKIGVSDEIASKKLATELSGPVVRGAVTVNGGSRSNMQVSPNTRVVVTSSTQSPLSHSSPSLPTSHHPPVNPTVASLASSQPVRVGSDRPSPMTRVNYVQPRPGTSGPSENIRQNPAHTRSPNPVPPIDSDPIPSLAMMELSNEPIPAATYYGDSFTSDTKAASPPTSPRKDSQSSIPPRKLMEDFEEEDEDDTWRDWDFDEDNPVDSDPDEPDDYVDSMSSFEEFYQTRVSQAPRTLGELQARLNAPGSPQARPPGAPPRVTPVTPPGLLGAYSSARTPSVIAEDSHEDSVEDAQAPPPKPTTDYYEEQKSSTVDVRHLQNQSNAVLEKELEKAKYDLAQAMLRTKISDSANLVPGAHSSSSSLAPTLVFAPVAKEGWLLKLSPNKTLGTRFQKRYFVLKGAVLAYYSNIPAPGTKPLGDVVITNAVFIYRLSGSESIQKTAYLQSENAFELCANFDGFSRTFLLVAPTMVEKREWCDALSMAKVNYGSVPINSIGNSALSKRGSQKNLTKVKKAERKISKKMGMTIGQ